MSTKRLRLFDWIRNERSLKMYGDWRASSVTNILLDGIRELHPTRMIESSTINGKIDPLEAVQLNAYRAGRDSVLNLIANLDDFVDVNKDSDNIDESVLEYLMTSERYSREDAVRIINNQEK